MEPPRFVHPDDPKPVGSSERRAHKAAVRAGVVEAPPRDELEREARAAIAGFQGPPLAEIVEAMIEDISGMAAGRLFGVPTPGEPMRSAGELAQTEAAAEPLTVGESVAPLTVGGVAPLAEGPTADPTDVVAPLTFADLTGTFGDPVDTFAAPSHPAPLVEIKDRTEGNLGERMRLARATVQNEASKPLGGFAYLEGDPT